jgi:hypothetical protein
MFVLNINKQQVMEDMQINWLAYAVAVVAQIVIGFLWFHPSVMGKTWAKANGITIEDMKPSNPGMTYGLTILYTLIFTFWLLINVTGPGQEDIQYHTFKHGLGHAALLTGFVILPVIGTPGLFEKKSKAWVFVHVGYWFLRMAVAQGILSMWR